MSRPSWRWSRSPARATSGSRPCASPISSAPRSTIRRSKSFIFRLDGQSDKVDRFIDLMKPLGLIEVARTGAVAISRGKEGI